MLIADAKNCTKFSDSSFKFCTMFAKLNIHSCIETKISYSNRNFYNSTHSDINLVFIDTTKVRVALKIKIFQSTISKLRFPITLRSR